MDWNRMIRLLDLRLHRVAYRHIMEMEQMTVLLLSVIKAWREEMKADRETRKPRISRQIQKKTSRRIETAVLLLLSVFVAVRMFTDIPLLLRNLATDCLPRICLRGNLFTNPLPGNALTYRNIYIYICIRVYIYIIERYGKIRVSGRKWSWPVAMYYLGICLERLKKVESSSLTAVNLADVSYNSRIQV
jgi:hypothetical protein